jgi:DNA invertase Pin-like site-specific DNA recombinase
MKDSIGARPIGSMTPARRDIARTISRIMGEPAQEPERQPATRSPVLGTRKHDAKAEADVKRLRDQGVSVSEISRQLRLPRTTCYWLLNRQVLETDSGGSNVQ